MDIELKEDRPRRVEIDLEAREAEWEIAPGHIIAGYAFNGQVPGPTIEARVGDTLVVNLKNNLPEATTIHWHGLRIPSRMDGTEVVQHPVKPGSSFQYRFTLPDAGTFWYHPHTHETVQLEKGLYGALIVRGHDEPVLDAERVLVLDDLKVDRHGDLARFGGLRERHEGRLGSVRLVNGRSDTIANMAAGHIERWRLVNVSNSRYVLLSIGGREFTMLGTDGGLLTAPQRASRVLLTPGDRVDLAVGPFSEGETVEVLSLNVSRGMVKDKGKLYATIRVGPPALSAARIPPVLREIPPLVQGTAATTRTVRLGGHMSLRRGVDFTIGGEMHHQDEPVRVGELQVWEVVNDTKMDHPFHLHGFFFQVLEVNGKPPKFLSWEDTVNVPAKGTVRIAWLPDDRPGGWMYHCHILEHHAAGMMAHFEVVRDAA